MAGLSLVGKVLGWFGLARKGAVDFNDPNIWTPLGGISDLTGISASGARLTADDAIRIAAFFACGRVIAEDVAKLPMRAYKKIEGGREVAEDQPADALLHVRPNPEMTAYTFRETITAWAVWFGRGYAMITRGPRGEPTELWPIHPSRVGIKREGGLHYMVKVGSAGEKLLRVEAADMLHVHGLGDGWDGWSLTKLAADTLGASASMQATGSAFFDNGAQPGGIIEHPANLKPEQKLELLQAWESRHKGAKNIARTALLTNGLKYTPLTVDLTKAQYIEGKQYLIEEVCRWFRMPPHKIQHLLRATFGNIEHQSIEYDRDTLMPWLVRWEQEATAKLLPPDQSLFFRHTVQALLRGDNASRSQFYSTLFQIGVFTPNEIRALEDMPLSDQPGANLLYRQGALMPLGASAEPAPMPTSRPAPQPTDTEDDSEDEKEESDPADQEETQP